MHQILKGRKKIKSCGLGLLRSTGTLIEECALFFFLQDNYPKHHLNHSLNLLKVLTLRLWYSIYLLLIATRGARTGNDWFAVSEYFNTWPTCVYLHLLLTAASHTHTHTPTAVPSCLCWKLTSPGTVGIGDGRSALHSGDEGRLEIKQVAVQVGDAEEPHRPRRGEYQNDEGQRGRGGKATRKGGSKVGKVNQDIRGRERVRRNERRQRESINI